MLRRIITSVPNFLTCCNLLSGCLACICAFSFNHDIEQLGGLNGRQLAWILVGLAAVFDFFDGAAARSTLPRRWVRSLTRWPTL